ncbi:hypothetical protein CYMTET_11253, partial [Cymbomonas tetramitiformis]
VQELGRSHAQLMQHDSSCVPVASQGVAARSAGVPGGYAPLRELTSNTKRPSGDEVPRLAKEPPWDASGNLALPPVTDAQRHVEGLPSAEAPVRQGMPSSWEHKGETPYLNMLHSSNPLPPAAQRGALMQDQENVRGDVRSSHTMHVGGQSSKSVTCPSDVPALSATTSSAPLASGTPPINVPPVSSAVGSGGLMSSNGMQPALELPSSPSLLAPPSPSTGIGTLQGVPPRPQQDEELAGELAAKSDSALSISGKSRPDMSAAGAVTFPSKEVWAGGSAAAYEALVKKSKALEGELQLLRAELCHKTEALDLADRMVQDAHEQAQSERALREVAERILQEAAARELSDATSSSAVAVEESRDAVRQLEEQLQKVVQALKEELTARERQVQADRAARAAVEQRAQEASGLVDEAHRSKEELQASIIHLKERLRLEEVPSPPRSYDLPDQAPPQGTVHLLGRRHVSKGCCMCSFCPLPALISPHFVNADLGRALGTNHSGLAIRTARLPVLATSSWSAQVARERAVDVGRQAGIAQEAAEQKMRDLEQEAYEAARQGREKREEVAQLNAKLRQATQAQETLESELHTAQKTATEWSEATNRTSFAS